MADPISIHIDDREILASLRELSESTRNLSPVLKLIGEKLTESTKARFPVAKAPDGTKWELNSVLSTLLYKDSDLPLTAGGILGSTIDYQQSSDMLQVGSNLEYAAMMQFGGTKAEFPHLWGDIPAREFLGISPDDKDMILSSIHDYLSGALG